MNTPDHVWLWIPYELEESQIYQSLLDEIKNDFSFYKIHCVYFEENLTPKSRI